ncbi:unnamed protein product [Clavelina lepadiformis]|uniref:Calponin-homology (CH) domain-containing protein n=1 Tax=Clavelina lepadiformis TaxID=159417 RepID=A0ABP0GLT9_CLALP
MISALHHTNVKSTRKIIEEAELSGELSLKNCKLKDLSICDDGTCDLLDNIPDFLTNLCLLEVLDLSNNSLNNLPSSICELKGLIVLEVQNNNILAIPKTIGLLSKCQKLNIGGNALKILPSQIAEMKSLLHLDVSRNHLEELPSEMSQLKLVHLDASSNKLATVPLSFENIFSLRCLLLHNNPLLFPSLGVLKKGRIHMFKSMRNDAHRSHIQNDFVENNKQFTVMNKAMRQSSDDLKFCIDNWNENNGSTRQSLKDRSGSMKEKPQKEPKHPPSLVVVEHKEDTWEECREDHKEPVVVSSVVVEPDVQHKTTDELSAKEDKTISAKHKITESPSKKDKPVHVQPQEENQKESPTKAIKYKTTEIEVVEHSSPKKRSPEHTTPKQVSELRSPVKQPKTDRVKLKEVDHCGSPPKRMNPEFRAKIKKFDFPGYTPSPIAHNKRSEVKTTQPTEVSDQPYFLEVIKPRTAYIGRRKQSDTEEDMSFTMRRKTEKIYEELELMENLRVRIESTLKMPLPADPLPALSDGVVLCHLANHVKARSIPTIHVPSPAVPKLSMAKCRRNVDNFLDACVKIGVSRSNLCNATDIVNGRRISRIVATVNDLLKQDNTRSNMGREFSSPSVKIAPSSMSVHKSQTLN